MKLLSSVSSLAQSGWSAVMACSARTRRIAETAAAAAVLIGAGAEAQAQPSVYISDANDTQVYFYEPVPGGINDTNDWGTGSAGNENPQDLFALGNHIYVYDTSDDRVYRYTTSGGSATASRRLRTDTDTNLPDAYGITIYGDQLWVATSGTGASLFRYSLSQAFSGAGDLLPDAVFALDEANIDITGLAANAQYVYALDDSARRVYRYSRVSPAAGTASKHLRSSLGTNLNGPSGMYVDGGSLYVVNDSTFNSLNQFSLAALFSDNQGNQNAQNTWLLDDDNTNPTGVAGFVLVDCDGDSIDDSIEIGNDPTLDCNNNGVLDSCEATDNPSLDCDSDGILDSCEIDGDPTLDCDQDGVLDSCEIINDGSLDCDSDGILDSCEIDGDPTLDCDTDGILDACEINNDGSLDCDSDGVLDSCEISNDPTLDCNLNGVLDSCEITNDGSLDCNLNGILDSCEIETTPSLDCDLSGILDSCEIATTPSLDCNVDGILDSCEIATTPSLDCDLDGVLDSCEITNDSTLDCDGDGILDSCEIEGDPSLDCDTDGILDSCEINNDGSLDCDADGILDSCEIANDGSLDCDLNGILDSCEILNNSSLDCDADGILDSCEINNDGSLDCDADGILDSCEINNDGSLDCDTDGVLDSCEIANDPTLDCDLNGVLDSCEIINDGLLDCNVNGILDSCEITNDGSLDCNLNGVLDSCEIETTPSLDCDLSGVLDSCEIATTPTLDCDTDGILDSCEITNDSSLDCDGDGILDSCEIEGDPSLDCDTDGILDSCEINNDSSLDCDSDGILDSCEITNDGSLDCDSDGILDSCEITNDPTLDCDLNGVLDSCEISNDGSLDCNLNQILDSCEISTTPSLDCNVNGVLDSCEIATTPSLDCNVNQILDSCEIATTPTLDCDADGILDSCEITNDSSLDCNGNQILDSCEIDGDPSLDCNENGIIDSCEINNDSSLDCDTDGILDSCEINNDGSLDCDSDGILDSCEISNDPTLDCNLNGVLDSCEITNDGSLDCNLNGILDSCEIATTPSLDCDTDGILDSCEITNDSSLDCNENQILDSCEIDGDPTLDCNENGILDACEIDNDPTLDCNENGIIDSCDITSEASVDGNQNGIPDECENVDLATTVTAAPDPVFVGEELTYSVQVGNAGPDAAGNVTLTVELDSDLVYQSFSADGAATETLVGSTLTVELGTLSADQIRNLSIIVVPTAPGQHSSTFTVSSTQTEGEPTDNVVVTTVVAEEAIAESNLSILKSANTETTEVGSVVDYLITVSNQGPDAATSVTVTDVLPEGVSLTTATTSQGDVTVEDNTTITVELGGMSPDGVAIIQITAVVTQTGEVENVAGVLGDTVDVEPADNISTASITVVPLPPVADVRVEKVADQSEVTEGENVIYTITVTNDGPDTATSVTLEDILEPGAVYVSSSASQGTVTEDNGVVTAELGDLAADSTASVTIEVTATVVGDLLNTATVAAATGDSDLDNNSGFAAVTVNELPAEIDLSIEKTADISEATVGSVVTYTITVTNNSQSDTATNVQVTDVLPATVIYEGSSVSQGTVEFAGNTVTADLESLEPGASAEVTIFVTLDAVGTVTNTASVLGNETDPNTNNNTDSAEMTVNPIPVTDLHLSKVANLSVVNRGQNLVYTVTVYNEGPDTATNVTVTDILPASLTYVSASATQGTVSRNGQTVTAQFGSLAPDDTAEVQITVTANSVGQVTNTASVTGAEIDPVSANNSDDVTVTVRAVADVSVTQTASSDPVFVMEPAIFTLTVRNNGPDAVTGVVVTDTLPVNVVGASAVLSQGTYNIAGSVLTANIGTLAPNATATVAVTLTPTEIGTLTNAASVASDGFDAATGNNSTAVSVGVVGRVTVIHTESSEFPDWEPFGQLYPKLSYSERALDNSALKGFVGAAPNRLRSAGWRSLNWTALPYSAIGTDNYVRAKFSVYTGGQPEPVNIADVPGMRLRVAHRFAQTSLLDVFAHTDQDPGNLSATDLRPSSDPENPSVYRVDFDPLDVPLLEELGESEGIMVAFEGYSTDPSDYGFIALSEIELGTYPAASLPLSAAPAQVYAPSLEQGGAAAGGLSMTLPEAVMLSSTMVWADTPGVLPFPAGAEGGFGALHEGSFGVTLDTTQVAEGVMCYMQAEFDPGAPAQRVKVEEGKQYVIRFHVTSTQNTSENAMLYMKARSARFGYVQKTLVGGAWAAGPTNNALAQQMLPGVGSLNPDKIAQEDGGWYNVLMYTPLAREIRGDMDQSLPIDELMPNLASEPGPGADVASLRDLKVGAEVLDTFTFGPDAGREKGHFTIDRIEVRVYDAVLD